MNPKVSIIVPIYNMESYLDRCLDSLLGQNLREVDIIAVNDGSTDSTLQILNEYAKKDHRIKIINRNNRGVSSARNEGIKAATGDFIGFVDPDDWIDSRMYETMYNTAIKDKADIVMCTYTREFGNHSKEKIFNLPNKIKYMNEEVKVNVMRRLIGPLNQEVANPELLDAWGTVWSKLYRTDIIKQKNLKFVDLKEIGTNEDTLFNIQAVYYSNSFVFLNHPFYHYWRANASSVTAGFKPDLLEQWFNLYEIIENFLKTKNMEEEYYLALNNRICLNTLGLGLNTISKSNKLSALLKIKYINSFLNDYRIKRSFSQFQLSHFPAIWKVFYYCAKMRIATGFYLLLVAIEILRKTIR
ncbi:glycosyltransferase family 2 protein [Priestia sp. AB]|uniref:glycosyltransferase family 2 protein n=1 Tax=Priestia sp. AB TaxID=3020890 RepID=UPI0023300108|nr:glycosyltransferase [Priestia sp. AB]MDC0703002.1 glycosyltransferase [Priestia sp. AB]MED4209293.1 glycosyltransferase [Priestia megaterium]